MKAFIAKNKYMSDGSRDYLIIASTKKEALETFEQYADGFGWNYLKKDFIEVGINEIDFGNLMILPHLEKHYSFGECFEFQIIVKTDYPKDHYIYHDRQVISQDDKTIKGLIKLFKNEYSSFFKKAFK